MTAIAEPRLRAGLVGCGAFGRHHARVYAAHPAAEFVGVYDANPAAARAVAAEHNVPAFASVGELAAAADAVSVAVPTLAHAATTLALLAAGKHVLVEKPIASSLAEADAMIAAARRARRVLRVGHLERFNPAVALVRPRLTRPLFFEVHRLSVFTPRSLDVDVLLDLMIHDLDIVLSFLGGAGQRPPEVRAVGLPVLSPRADIANVRVAFANGCVANFTASRVSTEKVRKLRFFQPGEYVSLDYARRDAHCFRLQPGPPPSLRHDHLAAPDREPLEAEITEFLAAIRAPEASGSSAPSASAAAGQPAGATGKDARAALSLALAAARAMERHARRLALPR